MSRRRKEAGGKGLVVVPKKPVINEEYCNLQIIKKLGQGGNGIVYQVEDAQGGGKQWALKLELRHQGEDIDPEALKEATFAVALHHPNIVTTKWARLDCYHPSSIMMLMEMATAGDLETYLRRGDLFTETLAAADPDVFARNELIRRVRIASQITCGLLHLHANGLIHHDLKPGNVFLFGNPTWGGAGAAAAQRKTD